MIEHKLCVSISSIILSETFLILRRPERGMIKTVYWSSCKVLVILVGIQGNSNFLDKYSKYTQITNFMKICHVRADLFHAEGRIDRQTDMTKLTVAFRNSAKAPKKADCICTRKQRGKWAVTEVKDECSSGCVPSQKKTTRQAARHMNTLQPTVHTILQNWDWKLNKWQLCNTK